MSRPTRYILPFGGALVTGVVGIAAYASSRINKTTKPGRGLDGFTFSPWELEVPHETVEFTAVDGVTLRGWWFPRSDCKTVVIGCPGHRRGKHDLLGIGSGLWRAGNNVLLFDFRGSWDSDPAPSSLAYKEIPDLSAAIAYANSRIEGARVGIIGYSMGAAVALLVAAGNPSVRAVVADSSFATMRDVVAQAFRRRRVPARPTVALTDMYNRARYGYGFASVRPIDVVSHISPRPLLLIHGGLDLVAPVEHAWRLYAAAGEPKELWIVDDARHCGAYFDDRSRYVQRVAEFFARSLGDDRAGGIASA